MKTFLIGALTGLLLGGAITYFMFVGVARSAQFPGQPIQAPDANRPAGTAQIVLRAEFFNEILTTIFRDMHEPAFPIAAGARADDHQSNFKYAAFQEPAPCDGKITILKGGSGVKTALKFDNNHISAPLAFSGSYDSIFGCLRFTGWAEANLELRFDAAQQVVLGRINVETVNLDGLNPVIGALVTPIVQTTLNNRVNPIRILDAHQIAVDLPIASTGGKLKAGLKDVRADLSDNALNLYVVYDFRGEGSQ